MSDGFLSRWTRRKLAVRAAERDGRDAVDVPEAGTPVETEAAPEAMDGSLPPTSPDAAPEPAEAADPPPELPSLDALTRESDLAPFLRAGVPTALRNAALRRMWSIDPAIRDFVSEAREYAYDWNVPGGVPGLGPLLPSDDVQAMLRRIIGGVPGEARRTDVPDGAATAEPRDGSVSTDTPTLGDEAPPFSRTPGTQVEGDPGPSEPSAAKRLDLQAPVQDSDASRLPVLDPGSPSADAPGVRGKGGADRQPRPSFCSGPGGREDGPDQTAEVPLLTAAMPVAEPVGISPPVVSEAVPAEVPPVVGPGPTPRARLRRHGGAMPA